MLRKIKGLIKTEVPIIAKFTIQSQINHKSFIKNSKDLEKAQKSKDKIGAIILIVNSPGGSPVYSSMISQKILEFTKEHPQAPFYTFAEDVAASGGYWLLCIG